MLDAWTVVEPLTKALAQRAARSAKAYAEDDRFEADEEAPAVPATVRTVMRVA